MDNAETCILLAALVAEMSGGRTRSLSEGAADGLLAIRLMPTLPSAARVLRRRNGLDNPDLLQEVFVIQPSAVPRFRPSVVTAAPCGKAARQVTVGIATVRRCQRAG